MRRRTSKAAPIGAAKAEPARCWIGEAFPGTERARALLEEELSRR